MKRKGEYLAYIIGAHGTPIMTTARTINAAKSTCNRVMAAHPLGVSANIVLLQGDHSRHVLATLRGGGAYPNQRTWVTTGAGLGYQAWLAGIPPRLCPVALPLHVMTETGERVPRSRIQYIGYGRPSAGEWYLSGAVVEAYRAKSDMPSFYHIVKIL